MAKSTTKTSDAKSGAKSGGGARGGLSAPVIPSAELAAIVGKDPLPRSEIVSKMWEHIKKNNLQNPENKREILADDKLKKVFGKDSVTMFEMNKHISGHVKPA
jgi:chromatin remodeling complex protein RSC6